MALEGTLDVLALPEILQMVSLQQKTGILTVQGEEDIIAVSFLDGAVVAADALNQTVDQGLGQVLASQGLVSPEDFAEVRSEHESVGKRVGDLLLERGFLDQGQFLEALREQTYQLLLQLLAWDQGEFKFYGGDEVAFEEGFQSIPVEEVLIRSVSDLDRPSRGEVPRLISAYRRVPGQTQVKIYGEDGTGPLEEPSALWFGASEKSLLAALDGHRTLGELASITGLGEYRSLYTLYRLLQNGLAEEAFDVPSVGRELSADDLDLSFEVDQGPSDAGEVELVRALPSEEEVSEVEMLDSPAAIAAVELPLPETVEQAEAALFREVAPSVDLAPVAQWACRLAASLVAVVLLWGLYETPRGFLYPYLWTCTDREALAGLQQHVVYRGVDRAARTFFLLEGRYPNDLNELVERGMLSPESIVDVSGRALAFLEQGLTYVIEPVREGRPVSDQAVAEAIAGDFLLDPEMLSLDEVPRERPLVLLD